MARRVDLTDSTPLIIDQSQLVNGKCAVCRCGLSGAWPMCDGTHKATIGEEPGKMYRYEREMPQGTIKRREVGELAMPGQRQHASTPPEHGAQRPRRPEQRAGQGEARVGAQDEARVGAVEDELLTGPAPTGSSISPAPAAGVPIVTGGAEGLFPKNKSGQGGESA